MMLSNSLHLKNAAQSVGFANRAERPKAAYNLFVIGMYLLHFVLKVVVFLFANVPSFLAKVQLRNERLAGS